MAPARGTRTRVAFLIRSLNRGGTERQLAELIGALDPMRFEMVVLTFYPDGAIWYELTAKGVELQSLHKRGRWEMIRFALRLNRSLRAWRPDVLHCYLVEPSIFGLVIGRWAGVRAVVWGIRSSNLDYGLYNRFGWVTFRMAALLSRFVSLMIANSEAGRWYHIAQGYRREAITVIPNGIDTDRYVPNANVRNAVRSQWGIRDEVVIGMVARLDPVKDHRTFLHAAAKLVGQHRNVRFVCVGGGDDRFAAELSQLVTDLELDSHVRFTGEHPQPEHLYPAFDVVCSTSLAEGFSNALAEALSCGVPCVATNVGDSAFIIGDAGMIVPPRSHDVLASALSQLAAMRPEDRRAMGDAGRRRVVREFSVARMAERTASAYATALSGGRARQWT